MQILGCGLIPVSWWFLPVEGDILFPVEHIQICAPAARKSGKICQCRLVNVHAAKATETSFKVSIAGNPLIEAFGAASQATEKLRVAYFHVFHFFSSHRKELFLLGLRQS